MDRRGAASVIRSLEYIEATAQEQRLESFDSAIHWMLRTGHVSAAGGGVDRALPGNVLHHVSMELPYRLDLILDLFELTIEDVVVLLDLDEAAGGSSRAFWNSSHAGRSLTRSRCGRLSSACLAATLGKIRSSLLSP